VVDAHVAVSVSAVVLVAALVVEVVEAEEAGVVEVDDSDVLDDCATELLERVVELARLPELEDVEVGVVVPPDDGPEAK
jgi:hypothetical protein